MINLFLGCIPDLTSKKLIFDFTHPIASDSTSSVQTLVKYL